LDNAPAQRDRTAEQTAALLNRLPQGDLRPFGNAQSFDPERRLLYFTLTGLKGDGVSQAVIVRSDGILLPYSAEAIQEEKFYPRSSTVNPKTQELIPPSVLARWSRQSLRGFLDAPTPQRTAVEVYRDIKDYLTRFVYHHDSRVLDLMALYTMGSYVHCLFDALPLLLITGGSQTAKTRLVEIVSALGFNGQLQSSLTAAALAREAACDQPLLCIDEAEKLGNSRNDQEICRLLRAMYRQSGTRGISGPGGTSVVFHLFCPVIIVNIVGVDDALRNRIIEITTVRREGPVDRFRLHQQHDALQRLRDDLYRFACTYVGQIYDIYNTFPEVDNLSDRTEELWLPILTLAKVIDATDPPLDLFDKMAKFAGELCQEKQEQEQFVNRDMRIIAGLYYFLEDRALSHKDTPEVNAGELTTYLKTAEDMQDLRKEEVSRVLRRAKIIDGTFRRRVSNGTASTNPLVHYKINMDRVKERAQTLRLLEGS
jgi:hypothetical protein